MIMCLQRREIILKNNRWYENRDAKRGGEDGDPRGRPFHLQFVISYYWTDSQASLCVYDATNGSNGEHDPAKIQERFGPRAIAFRSSQGASLQVPRHRWLRCRWVIVAIDKMNLLFESSIYTSNIEEYNFVSLMRERDKREKCPKKISDNLSVIHPDFIDYSRVKFCRRIYLINCKL